MGTTPTFTTTGGRVVRKGGSETQEGAAHPPIEQALQKRLLEMTSHDLEAVNAMIGQELDQREKADVE